MRRLAAVLILLGAAASAAPEVSLRPVARPAPQIALEESGALAQRPRDSAAQQAATRGDGPAQSLRPVLRPKKFARLARERERLLRQGAVCNDVDIQGDVVGRVAGRIDGCGIKDAVRLRSVSGVTLSQQSVVTCETAAALKTWLDETAKPALARRGGGLERLTVAAHYSCRTRNNKPGARISEHGKGRAIDISGLRLRDGTVITVREGWNAEDTSKLMRKLHAGACGPFRTVLGPESDRFHLDHFHFDVARPRSRPFCR